MKRLGLVPWLGITLVLTGLQLGALVGMLPVLGEAGKAYSLLSVPLALLIAGALQLVKIPVNLARLSDLGRPPDDAILTVIPLVSIGLFTSLLGKTPDDAERARRRRTWEGGTLAHAALVKGAATLWRGAALSIPVCIAIGVALGYAEATVPASLAEFLGQPLEARTTGFQVALAAAALLCVWLLLQLINRKKASRGSWLPTLLILPLLLLALAFWPPVLETFGLVAAPAFGYAAFGLAWWTFIGGLAGSLWISLAVDRQDHGGVEVGRALAWWRPRLLGAVAVHGGVVTVIFIGLQMLWVPGIVYAIAMAFAVHAAMLDPDKRAIRRSSRITRGRGRGVFNVLALGYIIMVLAQLAVMVGAEGVVALAGASDFVYADGSYAFRRVLYSWAYAQVFAGAVKLPPVGVGASAAVAAFVWGSVIAGLTWQYREKTGWAGQPLVAGAPDTADAALDAQSGEAASDGAAAE